MNVKRSERPHSGSVSFYDTSSSRFRCVDVYQGRITLGGPSSDHRDMTPAETDIVIELLACAVEEVEHH